MDSLRSQAIGRSTSDPPERVAGLPDLNLLPARYRPTRPSLTTVGAWLLFVILLGLLYPSYTRFQEASSSLAAQRVRLDAAQERLDNTLVQPQQLEETRAEIELARETAAGLRQALAEVRIQTMLWGFQLKSVVAALPASVEIESLRHEQSALGIAGTAQEYGAVLEYAEALRSLGDFDSVSVEAISRVEAGVLEELLAAEGEPPAPVTPEAEVEEGEAAPVEYVYAFTIRASTGEGVAEEVAP